MKKLEGLEIKAGNFKEDFSMNRNSTSRYLMFMERPMVTYLAPSRHLGISAKYASPYEWVAAGIHGPEVEGETLQTLSEDNNKAGQNNVVTLNVTEVKANTFNGTKVVRFQLINATKTADGSLASTALKQIKYRQAGLKAANISDSQVKDKSVIDIFVDDAEDAAVFAGYRTVTEEKFSWAF